MATTQTAKVFHLPVDKLPPNGVLWNSIHHIWWISCTNLTRSTTLI